MTWLAAEGHPPHVADRLLNHVGGAISGVAAVYQRHDFLAERRAALDAWGLHVLRCAELPPATAGVWATPAVASEAMPQRSRRAARRG